MIWFALMLLSVSMVMSAFFSGSETGFYRASRARLVMNAIQGNRADRIALMMTNQPALIVATVLIGNNIANYLVSLSIILCVGSLFEIRSPVAEMLVPFMMTPVLFVYGESLPKAMFFRAPNRLLRAVAPLLAAVTVLLLPASLVLWGMSRGLEWFLGQAPERVRLTLGRREMEKVLEESQEIGLLHPAQRMISQNFFLIASQPARSLAIASTRIATVAEGKPAAAFIEAARKQQHGVALVKSSNSETILGYVRIADLLVLQDRQQPVVEWRMIMEIAPDESAGEVLMQMQSRRHMVARIEGAEGQPSRYLLRQRLTKPLWGEPTDPANKGTSESAATKH